MSLDHSVAKAGKMAFRRWFACVRRQAVQLAGTALLLLIAPALAHETDQYTLPVGREFADLGPYLSHTVEAAVRVAARRTNDQIDAALSSERPDTALALQTSDYLASMVWAELFRAFPTNELLDAELQSPSVGQRFPGLVTLHTSRPSIYDSPLMVMDLSKAVRTLLRAGTVSVGGTLIGTDKIIHFINVGRLYHAAYDSQRTRGRTTADATALAIAATSANPFTSEDGLLGLLTTGIRSNADLAADLAGLKFYRNLSESVRIGTREWPPMLVRDGAFWRVQMSAGSQRFTAFVTPHWNEVLNPNKYLDYVALQVRETVAERCTDVFDGYRDRHGRQRSRAQFEAIESELATYFGEAYDHVQNDAGRVSVAEVCFEGQGAAVRDDTSASPDALGRTALWWAAYDGRLEDIERQVAAGQDLAATDLDGDTPLHAALRAGQIGAAQQLLRLGSPVNASALYGMTPLMLAASQGQLGMVQVLIDAGATVDRPGPFGRSALQLAIVAQQEASATLLLRHGADPQQVDDMGYSAAQLAVRRSSERLIGLIDLLATVDDLAASPSVTQLSMPPITAQSPPTAAPSIDPLTQPGHHAP